jgi:hypothetical protein
LIAIALPGLRYRETAKRRRDSGHAEALRLALSSSPPGSKLERNTSKLSPATTLRWNAFDRLQGDLFDVAVRFCVAFDLIGWRGVGATDVLS